MKVVAYSEGRRVDGYDRTLERWKKRSGRRKCESLSTAGKESRRLLYGGRRIAPQEWMKIARDAVSEAHCAFVPSRRSMRRTHARSALHCGRLIERAEKHRKGI